MTAIRIAWLCTPPKGEVEYVIWDGQMKITMNASVFATCVANATDRASLVIFRAYKTDAEAVWPEDMQADDVQPLLELQAGGKLGYSVVLVSCRLRAHRCGRVLG